MPRIDRRAMGVHHALDLLVSAQTRLSPERDPDRYAWLLKLTDRLTRKLEAQPDSHRPYLAHYVLCLFQTEACELHGKATDWREFMTANASGSTGIDEQKVKAFQEYNADFRRALVRSLLQALTERIGLEFSLVEQLCYELLQDPELSPTEVPPEYLLDLVMNAYLVSDPLASLKLLSFAVSEGFLRTEAIQCRDDVPDHFAQPIIRLALWREFLTVAHKVWETEFRFGIKEEAIDLNSELLIDGKSTPLTHTSRKLTVDMALMETSAGQRLIRSLFSGPAAEGSAMTVVPITTMERSRQSLAKLLEYVASDYSRQLFVDEQGREYRFGKMLSMTCALQFHLFLFGQRDRLDLPVFSGGDDQKASMATELSNRLRQKFGISVSAKTLYQTHKTDRETLYPALWKQWRIFAWVHSINVANWYEHQCYCSCIQERVAQLSHRQP
ncbi:hypothetical protein [Ferrimonas sp. YFM]|uniref:hypothetical protein n=1 Tax=Ferrimonas sp. YFM TaxID=3028878 RepID=UPI00257329E8|nr:hypothetical protein [Ferrimonas sp. YFM]BDY06755.1 hypothetical protein F0521_37960 [Ferrimonas sp. YFM]